MPGQCGMTEGSDAGLGSVIWGLSADIIVNLLVV